MHPPGLHWPASQDSPAPQVPQLPSQPSSPHSFPPQSGTHTATHWPVPLHSSPSPHAPQLPPHPLPPHSLPWHEGTQHVPSGRHRSLSKAPSGEKQLPQLPPHPSGPHCRPSQDGSQPRSSTGPTRSLSTTSASGFSTSAAASVPPPPPQASTNRVAGTTSQWIRVIILSSPKASSRSFARPGTSRQRKPLCAWFPPRPGPAREPRLPLADHRGNLSPPRSCPSVTEPA